MSKQHTHFTAFRFVSEDETVHGNISAFAVVTPASDATMLDESSEAELESLHFVKLDGVKFDHEKLQGEDYDNFMWLWDAHLRFITITYRRRMQTKKRNAGSCDDDDINAYFYCSYDDGCNSLIV